MENKKYELLTNEHIHHLDKTLYRIRSLRDFGNVKKSELGGYIEKEDNLSHNGDCWIYGNAIVHGNARVRGNASVSCNADISSNDDYMVICNIGSRHDNTIFYKCEDNSIRVICGCFHGTLDEFVSKVKETHGDNKYAKEYLAAIEMCKVHFGM